MGHSKISTEWKRYSYSMYTRKKEQVQVNITSKLENLGEDQVMNPKAIRKQAIIKIRV